MNPPENPETLAVELAVNNFTNLDDLNAHIQFLNTITAANATETINANPMITLDMSRYYGEQDQLDELLEPFPAVMHAALDHYQAFEINLQNSPMGDRGIEILANFLASPNHANYLSLNLSGNVLSASKMKTLATALESGHCPQNFTLNLSNTRLKEAGLQALTQALQSGHCPRNFILDLSRNHMSNNREAKPIADALTSGKCPEGFTLLFQDNTPNDDFLCTLANALESGQCPLNLTLNLRSEMPRHSATGLDAIRAAIKNRKCPPGLKLDLSFEHHEVSNPDKSFVTSDRYFNQEQRQLAEQNRNLPLSFIAVLTWFSPNHFSAGHDLLSIILQQFLPPNTTTQTINRFATRLNETFAKYEPTITARRAALDPLEKYWNNRVNQLTLFLPFAKQSRESVNQTMQAIKKAESKDQVVAVLQSAKNSAQPGFFNNSTYSRALSESMDKVQSLSR